MKSYPIKKPALLLSVLLLTNLVFGQVSGNVNYQNQEHFDDNSINVNSHVNKYILVSVKGLANVKSYSHVSIFSVSQTGKTADEVNTLLDTRINQAVSEIKLKNKDVETYIDMISFVPVYEFEVEKKVFSKKNYNEIPAGFELKNNIHIKYSDPNQLNNIISILSVNYIYDLIRVDYFSDNLENIKKDLMNKAKLILQDKIKNYEAILGISLLSVEKSLSDGYRVVLPVEMYQSYQAYNSSSLNAGKSNVNYAEKSTTLYYQPIIDKEFDFVINPTVFEPVIKVMYEIKVVLNREGKQSPKSGPEYLLVTPNGEIKNLNLKQ